MKDCVVVNSRRKKIDDFEEAYKEYIVRNYQRFRSLKRVADRKIYFSALKVMQKELQSQLEPTGINVYGPLSKDNHIQVPSFIVFSDKLTANDKLVYGYLYTLTGITGFAFPAIKKIANSLQISESSVLRSIKRLERIKVIRVIRFRRKEQLTDHATNFYILLPPSKYGTNDGFFRKVLACQNDIQ
jgi:hypothetical protein